MDSFIYPYLPPSYLRFASNSIFFKFLLQKMPIVFYNFLYLPPILSNLLLYIEMTVEEIATLVQGEIVCGESFKTREVASITASDLMSDVLTIRDTEDMMLLTGLSNLQSIRTCEMSDIQMILIVRGKAVTDEMIELAEDNDMIIVKTTYSMFKAAGILYGAGLSPTY